MSDNNEMVDDYEKRLAEKKAELAGWKQKWADKDRAYCAVQKDCARYLDDSHVAHGRRVEAERKAAGLEELVQRIISTKTYPSEGWLNEAQALLGESR